MAWKIDLIIEYPTWRAIYEAARTATEVVLLIPLFIVMSFFVMVVGTLYFVYMCINTLVGGKKYAR